MAGSSLAGYGSMSSGTGAVPAPGGSEGSRALLDRQAYRAYRRRQASALVELIPRESIREVYGHAREWARREGLHDGKDPLETLRMFCETVLPLPPFEVWRDDAGISPDPHLEELERAPAADPVEDSIPVDVRAFVADGIRWYASLCLFQARGAWRGFLTFHRGQDSPMLRTAAIFREDEPAEIRSRFLSFDEQALKAFLRSVRP